MANLTESPIYEPGIFQLEKSTPPLGGAPVIDNGVPSAGHANAQGLQLANRTSYLKQEVDSLDSRVDTAESDISNLQGQVAGGFVSPSDVSVSSAANKIPKADANGKLADAWIKTRASFTGIISRNVADKLAESVSILDFPGIVGADITTALETAFSSMPTGTELIIPAGEFNYTRPVVFPSGKRLAIRGAGARQSFLRYTGTSTTVDCFTVGDGTTEANGYSISGLSFGSSTLMTSGWCLRLKGFTRSRLEDVLVGHQDAGNKNLWNAVWFDNCDYAYWDGYQATAQNEGLRVTGGNLGRADLFLCNGKLSGNAIGLHVGGGFGGLYVDSSDIINNAKNMLIDRTVVDVENREMFFAPGAIFDSASSSHDAVTMDGINIDIQDTGGFIIFDGTWCASASILLRTGSNFLGTILWNGGIFFNAFNIYGGPGNGIQIGNVAAYIVFDSVHMRNIQGTAVTSPSGVTTNAVFRNLDFHSSVVNKFNNIGLRTVYSSENTHKSLLGKIAVGSAATIPASVDGNPSASFAMGPDALGGAMLLAHFRNDAGNPWLELGKSRGITAGAHTIIQNGDPLGGIRFSGSNGTTFLSGAGLSAALVAAPGSNDMPTELRFSTRSVGATAIGQRLVIRAAGHTVPGADAVYNLGEAAQRWNNSYFAVAPTVGSDARYKTAPKDITDKVLDAWENVDYKSYQLLDAVAEKGKKNARQHFGVIAQQVVEAFKAQGLDATEYGLLCHDIWEEIPATPAQMDDEGNIITPACPAVKADDRYSIRYEEALVLESALMRRTQQRLEARLKALEDK